MSARYYCKNRERRDLLSVHGALNGIDFLEVLDDPDFEEDERQAILVVYFIHPPAPVGSPPGAVELNAGNILILGGVRIEDIRVKWAHRASAAPSEEPNTLVSNPARTVLASLDDPERAFVVRTESAGDFSSYTLKLVVDSENQTPPDGWDPILSEIEFSFKAQCPSEFDCKSEEVCPPVIHPAPEINYLAKDYASFRSLMLDRLRLLMPDWKERSAADLQVALVELLAHAGDHLSYYQDAAATEAYLETARRRVSVRRHARLVDYFMHDGRNARAWIHLKAQAGPLTLPKGTPLLTRCGNATAEISASEAGKLIEQWNPECFETMFDVELHPARNEIAFYTWGDSECCLPEGATKATLQRAPGLSLERGDLLLFEEVKSPVTGKSADHDPARRHVVRLVEVNPATDGLYSPPTPVVDIRWHEADALPFPFCISTIIEREGAPVSVEDVCIARGNIVLADHGRTIVEKEAFTPAQIENRLRTPLRLSSGPVTRAEAFTLDADDSSTDAMKRATRQCLPSVTLIEDPEGEMIEWSARRDLLASDGFAREFVVETESDGAAYIRFGDGLAGKEPNSEKTYGARCRVGSGAAGNVGAGAIAHVAPRIGGSLGIAEVRNPLPAEGGVNPESMEQVRQFAPQTFRVQERAVTEKDYADVAMRFPGIQKAAASFRWTGSWFTVFLVVDRKGGASVERDARFKRELYEHMERYRLAGFDIELDDPVHVPLDLALRVCVKPGYFKSDVEQALLKAFSVYEWAPGERGFFHPDNFTFAQPVYLSRVYETAVGVDGVASANVTRFHKWGKAPGDELESGVLKTGKVEIVRLDNDPNHQENGKIEFDMQGGI